MYYMYAKELMQHIPGVSEDLQLRNYRYEPPDFSQKLLLVNYSPENGMEVLYGKTKIYERGPGEINYRDIVNIRAVLEEREPSFCNRCLIEADPAHTVYFQSKELNEKIAKATGIQDGDRVGYHLYTVQNIKSLSLETNDALYEFAHNAQLFQSLQELTVQVPPNFNELPITELLVVPPNVHHLEINDTLLKNIDMSYAQLESIYIDNNHILEGIHGLEAQYDCHEIRVSGLRHIEDFHYDQLREQNPDASIWISVEDLGTLQRRDNVIDTVMQEGGNTHFYEVNSYETVVYDNPRIWQEMDLATDQWIHDNIRSDMKLDEAVAAVYRHFAVDVHFPAPGKDYVEEHSAANSILKDVGVCESKCKAMQFTLAKLGVPSEVVFCRMDSMTSQERMARNHGEQGSKYMSQQQNMDDYRVFSRGPNHAIIRVQMGKDWMYFDPTNDSKKLNTKLPEAVFSPLSFRSQDEMCRQTYFDRYGNLCGYKLEQGEISIPSGRDMPRSHVKGLIQEIESQKQRTEQKQDKAEKSLSGRIKAVFHQPKQEKAFMVPDSYAFSIEEKTHLDRREALFHSTAYEEQRQQYRAVSQVLSKQDLGNVVIGERERRNERERDEQTRSIRGRR